MDELPKVPNAAPARKKGGLMKKLVITLPALYLLACAPALKFTAAETTPRPAKPPIYAYGPEREKHDAMWSGDSRRALVAILDGLSIPARIYAKNLIMKKALEFAAERSLKSIGGVIASDY